MMQLSKKNNDVFFSFAICITKYVDAKYICAVHSRREPEEPDDASKGRDVFNEKPPAEELLAVSDIGKAVTTSLPDNVVCKVSLFQFPFPFFVGVWVRDV